MAIQKMRLLFILYIFFLCLVMLPAYSQPGNAMVMDVNLENYNYPFPVKYINLYQQQQPVRMAYMDVVPEKANGKVVLLLHGKNFNGAYWRSTAMALVNKGYRVIMPDQVGFGKSSKPAFFQYSFQQLATNTKILLDSLQTGKVHVVGHSMGGMLAVRIALSYPSFINSLTLVNPIGLEDWKLKVPYKTIDDWYARELKQNEEGIRNYQQTNYYHGTWQPAYEEWLKPLSGWTKNKDYPIIAWNAALTYDMIFTQPVLYEFDQLRCPVLLVIGQSDRTAIGKTDVPPGVASTMGNYPLLGRLTQQKIANSKLVEIQGVGHLPHIESFTTFFNALESFIRLY
jgi:pimeloyl-ACP methyl ester carboxylesterase